MMRILILGDINSPHIQKWAEGLSAKGVVIGIFSLSVPSVKWFEKIPDVKLLDNAQFGDDLFHGSVLKKFSFIKILPRLKRAISDFRPVILHAHYATSYGLLGALSGFKPFFISVWGSDVYLFPRKGRIFRSLLSYNLERADKIFSAGRAMAAETALYTRKPVEVIPFGIDTAEFAPLNKDSTNDFFVFGCIKKLEHIYGIEDLLNAFSLVKSRTNKKIKLFLVGDGTQRTYYEKIIAELGLKEDVVLFGNIPFKEIVQYHNKLDVAVYVSHSESFGVSVLESCACGVPVIVSDVGGLPEVVINGKTGIVVEARNINKIADAMLHLLDTPALRTELGKNARQHVTENYEWSDCIDKMIQHYKQIR